MPSLARTITESIWFQRFIIGIIVFIGIVMGLETYPSVMAKWGNLLHALDKMIIGIFVIEIALKLLSHGRNFLHFFNDPWNVFDFIIVAICLLPLNSEFAAVLRLVRILRVLRLISVLPRLQILIGALLRSVPSMGYVALLLVLLVYMYAVMGTVFFGLNDPLHFGTIQNSMLTLFQVVTLEGWAEILKTQMYGSDQFGGDQMMGLARESLGQPLIAAAYFVSFILFGTMIMLNLLIGVVVNSMSEMHQEAEEASATQSHSIKEIETTLAQMEKSLAELKKQLIKKNQD